MNPAEIDQAIRDQAPAVAERIRAAAAAYPGDEANFRRRVERVIEDFAKSVDLQLDPDHECTLLHGRADSVYNRFVIEFEPPGSLRPTNTSRPNQHAIEQVQGYIQGLHERERQRRERMAGAVTDGIWLLFVRFNDGRFERDDPVRVADESTGRLLRFLVSLSTELPVTPGNLVRDFGENTPISRPCVSRLYAALVGSGHPRVEALFGQWSLQFSEICGYEPGSSRLDVGRLAEDYGVQGQSVDPLRLFFAIHTYYATFIKLLAVQVASFYAMPKFGTRLHQVANRDTASLREYLANMERGGVFADFGIRNFLESDFFGWYLDVWDDQVGEGVRGVIARLSEYSLVTLDVDPESTRDLLKRLYQDLMPKALRHDLGEYYTPDWLAERLLNQLGFTADRRDLPSRRILDPACGSGTFLVLAIRRVRQWAAAQSTQVDEPRLLDQILANIVGFDLNPLAVISARTNYLLALGDLLQHQRDDINIPVYLADSILTPAAAAEGAGQLVMGATAELTLSFQTSVGRFAVPQALASEQRVDELANLLEECVTAGSSEDAFRTRLLAAFSLDPGTADEVAGIACALFSRLAALEQQGIDGIWARIIKNAFAPLFSPPFDYVAGNPPWVRWDSLPDQYRNDTKPLWRRYGLFTLSGWEARMGGGKKDLCALMTYAVMDRHLLPGGKLGFVVTQTLFKTSGAAEGFRRFQLGDGAHLRVVHVDDLSALKPFEGAANRTAVVVVEKGAQTTYPVPYAYWRKRTRGGRIPEHAGLDEVVRLTRTSRWHAVPVDPARPTSPWLTARPQAISALRKVLGGSAYEAQAGVACCGCNDVFWVRPVGRRPGGLVVVANLRESAPSTAALEADVVYPLLRGQDISRWSASAELCICLAQDPAQRRGLAEEVLQARYPRTHQYLARYRAELEGRKSSSLPRPPFYSVLGVAEYTLAPYKLVWADMAGSVKAAVIGPCVHETLGEKPVVPEHHVMMVPFAEPMEPHYLCAVLSSAPAELAIVSYTVSTQISTHVLKNVAVPAYDAADPVHRRLSDLSSRAHAALAARDMQPLTDIQTEVDQLVGRLWGLTNKELKDIQDSLADLRS